jgi:hypothetical protein
MCTLPAWNRILNRINKVNQALQSKNVITMQASKMLTGLKSTLIELREALTDESFIYAKKIEKELEIPTSLPEKRGRKRNIHHPGEESSVLFVQDHFSIQLLK